MARFFLHLRDHVQEMLDAEGVEFRDVSALRKAVMTAARDIMAGDLVNGVVDLRYRIDAEDGMGAIVYSLPFKHAVSIIPE